MALHYENRMEHISTLPGQNAGFFNNKAYGINSYHCALRD